MNKCVDDTEETDRTTLLGEDAVKWGNVKANTSQLDVAKHVMIKRMSLDIIQNIYCTVEIGKPVVDVATVIEKQKLKNCRRPQGRATNS
jgi:hypothetical protein